ncbi:Inner spore coat protein H [Choanephora cucurbitarum]|uniref:Inner spore coat protein H n=1 Tax=Choanephora cucurbitarum TaxID=101091 RepID=A0A1C7NR40_9FUNG|nr:Inner spore coat protein H [Choanephora cucurbitarum]
MVMLKKLPFVFGLLSLVSAGQQNELIDYSVVGAIDNAHSMAVVVDNTTYLLIADKGSSALHTGQAPIAKFGYQYVKIDKNKNLTESVESFLRKPVSENTVYEFFNRTWNTRQIAKLPQVYKPLNAIHRIKSDLHKDGQIPTISIEGSQADFDVLHSNTTCEDCKVNTNVTYIGLKEKYRFENVRVTLAGRSSTSMSKLSYNIKLKKKDRLFDYRRVKLRAMATDPSYLREQLAYDVIESVGLVSSQFSFCRLLINNKDVGLFGIIDTFQDSWLANVFAEGDKEYENGNLYQGIFQSAESARVHRGSDLDFYNGNLTAYQDGQYKVKVNAHGEKEDNYKPLMDFTEFVANAPTEGPKAVKAWKKRLDVDSFLRSMALEKIMGYSDGYSTMADNYYILQLPKTNKFFWISSDMDMTLGNTVAYLDDMLSGDYKSYPGLMARPLTSKVLSIKEFRDQFNNLIREISEKLVNPVTMNKRINDMVSMLREDVEWDQSLPRLGETVLFDSVNSSSISESPYYFEKVNLNLTVAGDFATRLNGVPFDIAINGPIGRISLTGLKEWIQKSSENIKAFYKETSHQP